MTDKLTLTTLDNLENELSAVTALNNNSTAIITAINNSLSRNGADPNEMEADIDMNSNRVLNLPYPASNNEPIRKIDLATIDGFEDPLNLLDAVNDAQTSATAAAASETAAATSETAATTSATSAASSATSAASSASSAASVLAGAVRFDTSQSLTTANIIQVKSNLGENNFANAEQYGAVGDGTTDDTTALQTALDTGKILVLGQNKTYKITQTISVTHSYSGIIGSGNSRIYCPKTSFTNTLLDTGHRVGTNAVAVFVKGALLTPFTPIAGVQLRNFIIQSEVQDGRYQNALVIYNVTNSVVDNVELFGFPLGLGINIASCLNCTLSNNYIHDFTDNTTGWNVSDVPQVTGIQVDGDLTNSIKSEALIIRNNFIRDITVGSSFISTYGNQSDGINLARMLGNYHVVQGNRIDNTGEGIDNFTDRCTITGNVITNVYNFGIKLIHGASFCSVTGNTVTNYGLAGLLLSGSSQSTQDTSYNVYSSNTVFNGNYNSAWTSQDNAAMLVGFDDTTIVQGNVITDNLLHPGAGGKWALNHANAGGGTQLFASNGTIAGTGGTTTGSGS